MAVDRLIFPRPDAARVFVERVPTGDVCPSCGSDDVARYPVANYLGPRMVVKCQACFTHLANDRPVPDDHWPAWRSPTRDWPASRLG